MIPSYSPPASAKTLRARYLGDLGTKVELDLKFRASHLSSGTAVRPVANLKAATAAAAAAATATTAAKQAPKELRKHRGYTVVRFRGFVEAGLPKVMNGEVFVDATEEAVKEHELATMSMAGFAQVKAHATSAATSQG